MEDRKSEHIRLAFKSQTGLSDIDDRFYYEPMLSAHPDNNITPFTFLGKTFRVPVWVSSMTGGTALAKQINHNLARVCKEFGMGMGLGSCRMLLDSDEHLDDFNVRHIIGDEQTLFANLGIGQLEQAVSGNEIQKIHELVDRLSADGLIIHVNPMQEWIQKEGDQLMNAPIDTIARFLDKTDYKVIVKEVGQGIGPESLQRLLKMPLAAIEFAAYGGTNFAMVELLRSDDTARKYYEPLTHIGADAASMVEYVNDIIEQQDVLCKQIIISGGVKTFLDGYYLINKSKLPAIYGQASSFLAFAGESYERLYEYVEYQIRGLQLAQAYLKIKD